MIPFYNIITYTTVLLVGRYQLYVFLPIASFPPNSSSLGSMKFFYLCGYFASKWIFQFQPYLLIVGVIMVSVSTEITIRNIKYCNGSAMCVFIIQSFYFSILNISISDYQLSTHLTVKRENI